MTGRRTGGSGQLSGEPSEPSLGLVGQQPSPAAGEWQQQPLTVEQALARTTPPDTRTRLLHRTSSAEPSLFR